jgi:protein-disulfide isomerase-like protein with CxxC motif
VSADERERWITSHTEADVREIMARERDPRVTEASIRALRRAHYATEYDRRERADGIARLAVEAGTSYAVAEEAVRRHDARMESEKRQAGVGRVEGLLEPPSLSRSQRDTISKIPAARAYLERTNGKVTDKALAKRLEIDRGTLARWREKGILPE